MSLSFRSSTMARLFAGVSAAAALAIAAPVFADPASPSIAAAPVPTQKPVVSTTDTKAPSVASDVKAPTAMTDSKASSVTTTAPTTPTTTAKPVESGTSTDTKAATGSTKSSDAATSTDAKDTKAKVATNEAAPVKHHHKAKTTKPVDEKASKTDTSTPTSK